MAKPETTTSRRSRSMGSARSEGIAAMRAHQMRIAVTSVKATKRAARAASGVGRSSSIAAPQAKNAVAITVGVTMFTAALGVSVAKFPIASTASATAIPPATALRARRRPV